MRFHAKKAFAYRTDFSDSVPAAKAFLFLFFIRPKEVRQRFQRFPEHLHFLFSEFRHHGIRHLLVEFCVMMECLPSLSGQVDVDGKISALLELGAGFNMDYTGIENVYMNGTMMGYTKKEMDAKLQDILDFAEIGDFVYQPVKTYSSGMFVRLAFALAINVDPEILIVDEALSVGDVFFQSKCYRRMEEIRKKAFRI